MRPKRNLRSNLGRFMWQILEVAAAAERQLTLDYKWLLLPTYLSVSWDC